MTARTFFPVIMACITAGFLSCDVDVPIQEMVKARTTIEKARAVMAETHDPDNLAKAVDWLKKSHDFTVENDVKNAKSSAEKSIVYGDLAIQTSLPKAVDDALTEAGEVYDKAGKLNAEEFAPEKYSEARVAIDRAVTLKNEKDLWGAYQKAREAVAAGTEAKEISLERVPALNERIARLKKDIDDLGAMKLTAQQKNEITTAGTDLDRAGDLIVANNVQEAVPLIAKSEEAIAAVKAQAVKVSARERIAQLRTEAEQLRKKRGSEFAGEDIDVVITTLNEAEALLEQDKTDEANQKIDDAERSLAIAKEKTTRGLAIDKARSVEKLLEETRRGDAENKFKTETDSAAEMIADGKKLLEEGSYGESLAKFEEAESLLYSLGVAKAKEDLLQKEGAYDAAGKRVYTVVYNRKKRDCLWRIADKMYKNARLWPLIYMANKDQIKDPDLIFPGQKFVIPEVPKKKDEGKTEAEKNAVREEQTGGDEEGSGQPGDTVKPRPEIPSVDDTEEDMTE